MTQTEMLLDSLPLKSVSEVEREAALTLLREYGAKRRDEGYANGKADQAKLELRGRDEFMRGVKAERDAEFQKVVKMRDDLAEENQHNGHWILRVGQALECDQHVTPEIAIAALKARASQGDKAVKELEELREIFPTRDDRQIVDQTNELAIKLMSVGGWNTSPGSQLWESDNPRAKMAWQMACAAQEALTATEPDEALRAVQAEEAAAEIERIAAAKAKAARLAAPLNPLTVIGTMDRAIESLLKHYDLGDGYKDADEKAVWEQAAAAQTLAIPFLRAPAPAPRKVEIHVAPSDHAIECPACDDRGWNIFTGEDGRPRVEKCDTCNRIETDYAAALEAGKHGVGCEDEPPHLLVAGEQLATMPPPSPRLTVLEVPIEQPGKPLKMTLGERSLCQFVREDGKQCNIFSKPGETHSEHKFTCGAVIGSGERCDLTEGHAGPCQEIPF